MTIEELKADPAKSWPWGDLAPEILALVEAVSEDDEKRFKGSVFVFPTIKAVRAFNAKLASL